MKKLFLAIAMALPMLAMAQKVGHVNTAEILQAMPELAEAQKTLEATQNDYKKELEQMQQELQTKYQDFQKKAEMLNEATRNKEMMDLQDLDSRIQKFAEFSQQELQKKQAELMQPIYEKMQKAIEAEGKAKGLAYVLDAQTVLFAGKDAVDITPAVKKALGLK